MLITMGSRLKELRTGHKMTQQQLAQRIGLAPSAISSYESGYRYPSYEVLIKYSRIFHVTTDYLLGVGGLNTIDISELSEKEKKTVIQIVNSLIQSNG